MLIASCSPPFPLRTSILRWNRSDEAKCSRSAPTPGSRELPPTEQARIGSSADRLGWLPTWLIRRVSAGAFAPRTRFTDFGGRPIPMAVCARRSLPGSRENPSLQVALRSASGAFAPIIEDGQPQLHPAGRHPAGRSSFAFAELDRETQTSFEKRAVPR
jgi:hypothetical protein